jgi:membrane fusion protein (multidrug efflux system)
LPYRAESSLKIGLTDVKNRKLVVRAVGVALVLVAIGGWYWIAFGRFVESTDNAYIRGEITPISPKVGGYVSELLVADNQRVSSGDVLLRIEDHEYVLAVEEAGSKVAEAEAGIVNIDARLARQQSLVAQASANIQSAEAELNRAVLQLERERRLMDGIAGTPQRYERAEADQRMAAAEVARATAAHDGAQLEIAVMNSERKLLESRLAQTMAALDTAKIDLNDTKIVAPIDGMIGNRSVRAGELVQPGEYLMVVVPADDIWIEANFKETQLTRMRVGQEVSISVDTYPGTDFSGRIESFSPASGAEFSLIPPENATGNFTKLVQRIPVRIIINADRPADEPLRPGMSVVVKIDTKDNAGESASGAVAQDLAQDSGQDSAQDPE